MRWLVLALLVASACDNNHFIQPCKTKGVSIGVENRSSLPTELLEAGFVVWHAQGYYFDLYHEPKAVHFFDSVFDPNEDVVAKQGGSNIWFTEIAGVGAVSHELGHYLGMEHIEYIPGDCSIMVPWGCAEAVTLSVRDVAELERAQGRACGLAASAIAQNH